MRTPFVLFSSVLLFLSGNFIYAQTIHRDYIDGEVYIKVRKKSQNGPNLPNGAVNMASELPFLAKAGHISNATEARRSFYLSASTELQNVYRLRIGKPKLIQAFIKEIAKDANVEYVERVPYHKIISVPNDSHIANQFYLDKIKAKEAWDVKQGSADIVVAVVDNAIQTNHEDLAANMLAGRDISDNDNDPSPPDTTFYHGTHVAGLVGAVTNNNLGIASAANNRVRILPVKVTPDNASPEMVYHGFEGIAWAVANGADIINISWGGSAYSVTEQAVINDAYASGVVIIAAAGNEGLPSVYYPASYDHVISIASTTSLDEKSYFSNYHSGIDLSAPGSGIYSTVPVNKYSFQSGTSMAAPIASSVFAYVWSVKRELTPLQLENLIKNTSDEIETLNPSYTGRLGSGRVNMLKAVSCLEGNIQPVITPAASRVVCQGNVVQLSSNLIEGASYQWKKNGQNVGSNQPTFTATETGNYTVLITKNTCGILALPVKVSVIPDSFEISSDLNVACVGDSILLKGLNLEGVTYQWKKDGSNIGANMPQLYARQDGNYTLSLSGNGCETISVPISLSFINLNPVITADNSTILCAGQSTTLSVGVVNYSTYQWTKDNNPLTGATNPSYQVSEAGEYYVQQKLGQCAVNSKRITITNSSQRAASPDIVNREICEGRSLTPGNGLLVSAGGCIGPLIKTYQYTGNVVAYDGNEQSGLNPSINVTDMGTQVLGKLKVTIVFEKKDQVGLNDCGLPHAGGQPYNDEISFNLQSPNGTVISLLASNTYNYYVYNGQITLTFEDGKPIIAPESSPVSGTFSSNQALAMFSGQTVNGTWTLVPTDNSSGDPLCVSGFSIDVQIDNVSLPNTFSWWSSVNGGLKLGVGHEYVAPDTLPGVHTYYVQNECAGACPSDRIPVTLDIKTADTSVPDMIAYAISPSMVAEIRPLLQDASLVNQNPTTIQNGNNTKLISDKAALIDPVTVCSGADILFLGTGCSGVYRWSAGKSGAGIIVSPTETSTYSVRCKDLSTGCLSPLKERQIYVKAPDVVVTKAIPQNGLQTFTGKKVSISSVSGKPSATIIKADNSILLLPGFAMESNSIFTAGIENTCVN
jgi:hypothetical protein